MYGAYNPYQQQYKLVRKLQRGAERELAEARDYISELSACNWDMVHAFDMGGER